MKRLLLSSLALLGLPWGAAAQLTPNRDLGFQVEKAFHVGDIDTINAFNGNLVVRIPLGEAFPVGGQMSYQLTLVYNSNLWEVVEAGPQGQQEPKILPYFNAGLGWRLSLGELMEAADTSNHTPIYSYLAPDGAQHTFGAGGASSVYLGLHGAEDAPGELAFSRDGTYLQLRAGTKQVYFPDGTVHTFATSCRPQRWCLTRMEDPFGNFVNVSYGPNQWVISDSHGRQHVVDFLNQTSEAFPKLVTHVGVEAFAADTARTKQDFNFSYETRTIPRACPNSTGFAAVSVPLLVAVTLEDGSAWKMPVTVPQGQTWKGYALPSPSTLCANESGQLTALELPTGGRFEWTYGAYLFPTGPSGKCQDFASNASGVVQRQLLSGAGSDLGKWIYAPALEDPICTLADKRNSRWLRNRVTNPLNHVTEQFFSVASPGATGWDALEYGLPLTREYRDVQDGPNVAVHPTTGRFLSKRWYDSDGTTLLRSEYVTYEKDPGGDAVNGLTQVNQRLVGSTTRYHDDGNTDTDVAFSDFDGVGHYRTVTKTASGFQTGNAPRVETTRFNPSFGSYPSSFQPLAVPYDTWVLGTFTEKTVAENGLAERTDYGFEAAKGFLTCERRRKTSGSLGATDVLTIFGRDAAGNVASESFYGGDVQGLGTTSACTAPAGAPVYRLLHTYQGGVRASSQYEGQPWKLLDREIDTHAAKVRRSRDVSGVETAYEWDVHGRLTKASPTGEAATVHTWFKAGAQGARVETALEFTGASNLPKSKIVFDALGRVEEEQKQMPDGSFNRKRTGYNGAGWVAQVSETQAAGEALRWTRYQLFDPFGRPRRIRPSEYVQGQNEVAHDVTLDYKGIQKVFRTVPLASLESPSGTVAERNETTTEIYDPYGRLFRVKELAGPNREELTAEYLYDAAGRLRQATLSQGALTQMRTFEHDGRGFLLRERHPEKDVVPGETWDVLYEQYDPRGNARRQRDGDVTLTFGFDAAERLRTVTDSSGRLLQELQYGSANAGSNRLLGKLTTADRYHYVNLATPGQPAVLYGVLVRERYQYLGTGGRASVRDTDFFVQPGQTGPFTLTDTFNQTFGWNELGQVSRWGYPIRIGQAGARNLEPVYTRGWLTGFTDGTTPLYGTIAYHPNGLVATVAHTNGVTETTENDEYRALRPKAMGAAGPSASWSSGDYQYDGAGNVKAIGSSWFLYDAVSRLSKANLRTNPAGTGGVGVQSYAYDAFGNQTATTTQAVGSGTSVTRNTPTTTGTNRLTSGAYDARGNLTALTGATYEWDALGSLSRMRNGAEDWFYFYTADGERLHSLQIATGPSQQRLWTLRDLDGKVLRRYAQVPSGSSFAWQIEADYVYRGSQLVAAETPQGRRHFHLDHLGTPRLVTNASGQQVSFHTYFPFGEEATAFDQTNERLKFTGHERDLNATGGAGDDLDYMHARYCSPVTGRFLAVDPARESVSPRAPQSWNRYSYVLNNPLKMVDSSGELPFLVVVGAAFVGGFLFSEPANTPAVGEQGVPRTGDGGLIAGAMVGGALGLVPAGGGASLASQLNRAFRLPPILRGQTIEKLLATAAGGGALPQNFPTIDRFLNGVATSVKSIDLGAKSYQNVATLTTRLNGFVDRLARFQGRDFGGAVVAGDKISSRVLELVVQRSALTVEQALAIQKVAERAQASGVTIRVIQAY